MTPGHRWTPRDMLHETAPEGWAQGRTACGELPAALALAAIQQWYPDLPLLRSPDVMRLPVSLEYVDDIIADLEQALGGTVLGS